jgi:FkbM family methyltransferase
MRRPLKIQSLKKLRQLGVPVAAVVDVGILTGTRELMEAFGDRRHILIEPIVEWNERIRKSYAEAGIDFELINVAASDRNGTMNMETSSVVPGRPISHARLTEKTSGATVRQVPVRTLDSLLPEHGVPAPYLLKIDVDGAEPQILAGATATLTRTNAVVIEANIRNFIERATLLQAAGFELFDIVDPCYYDDRLRQFDLVFLNSAMVAERGLDMYKQTFDAGKWVNYR